MAEQQFKTGNEVDFEDGVGPKSKGTPDHYASDWQKQAQEDALVRNYAGLQHRLLELQGMPSTTPEQLAAAENDVAEARAALPSGGQKTATKRPAKAKTSR